MTDLSPVEGGVAAVLMAALEGLLERKAVYDQSQGSQADAYYALVKYAYPEWEAAKAALRTAAQASATSPSGGV